MKRLRCAAWIMLLAAVCICLPGCRLKNSIETPEDKIGLNVYASFYPIYALADLIVEGIDEVHLHCLVQPQDGCLRAYQLSDWDLALLSGSADAVLTGGRGLESFESILYALGESGPAVSSLLYNMDLKQVNAAGVEEEKSHWTGDNPHIYMDAEAAKELCTRIGAALSLLDPGHEALYAGNLQKAEDALRKLKDEILLSLEHLHGEKVIVMNEALVYADAAYGLEIDLCYQRESGESIDGRDLEKCLEALKASDAKVILLEKQAPQRLCQALEDAGYSIARMDILSTRRADEGFEGYFEAQRANVQAIIEAFSKAV